jgi:hypothetical protein
MVDIKEIKVNIALLKRKIGFDVSGQTAISNIEKSLTELERLQQLEKELKELKQDVRRYFNLEHLEYFGLNDQEAIEYDNLYCKLSNGGKLV